jgi:Fe-S-cluster containining protein
MLIRLSQPYPARRGTPVIHSVDAAIYTVRYFSHCMQCTFCNDWCCDAGVQVDVENIDRIRQQENELKTLAHVPEVRWFRGRAWKDEERPGGAYRRTNVIDGACVFLDRKGRGCLLHKYSLQAGLDYHELKPIICSLFPLTFAGGALLLAYEVRNKTLVCLNQGPTVFISLRSELQYFFGDAMVEELDSFADENADLQVIQTPK